MSVHPTETPTNAPRLVVVPLSESFGDVWSTLAEGLGLELSIQPAEGPVIPAGTTAAVVLAAGGAESDVPAWLESNHVPPRTPVYAVGADPGRRTAARLVRKGATDYFAFPDDVELLSNAVENAAQRRLTENRKDAAAARTKPHAFSSIVGESTALKETLSRAERILEHPDTTALIVGETGTGKELLVRAIHDGGPRRAAPFVPVNCSALPKHLVETELFGHERGAFTDAHVAKPGLFEVADGGTLFLDELATLPLDVQAKLLRVLEDGEVRRVGATRAHHFDVRIIAATNEPLDRAVNDGTFREDLYYRLSVITLQLPPLRERGADVELVAQALLAEMAQRHGVPVPVISGGFARALSSYHWPGNVRELRNALERALLLSRPGKLDSRELLAAPAEVSSKSGPIPFPATIERITKSAAQATLEFCGGNRSEAARTLGISRQRLRRLLG